MYQPLSIRTVLLLITGVLTFLMTLLIFNTIYFEWNKLKDVRLLEKVGILSDQLLDTTEALSIERDTEFSLLYATDRATIDDLQKRLDDSQHMTDAALQRDMEFVKIYDLTHTEAQLEAIKDRYGRLQVLRSKISAMMEAPLARRDPAFADALFAATTDLILQTRNLWMKFIAQYSDIDPLVNLQIRFKYFLSTVMEYSGRQRAMISRLITENADPTPPQQADLLRWQGSIEFAWGGGETLADQAGLFPALRPYFEDTKSHYFSVYNSVRDIFYIPGNHHGSAYPISVELWLDLATQANDSLFALKDAVYEQSHNYIKKLERKAIQSIVYHSVLLLFALCLCAYSFWVIAYRVIRPINRMVEALIDVTQGKAMELAPSIDERRDEIGKLAHILRVFQKNSAEIKQAHEALNESEKKLHQAQKMEAIGNLTGGMAHDFNNLLGIVIGNLDLVIERVKDEEIAQLSQAAIGAALRGADLTRRLLAFARKQPLQPQRIEVNKLVEGITTLLRRMLGEDVRVTLNLSGDTWPIVVDPTQLETAITNLATNARDAMPRGGLLIIATSNKRFYAEDAAAHPDITPGDYVAIEVSDTGSGMPPEISSRIFEPFFTTKERDKGTGLGLSMVFGFVKQSGGHINVYSEVGAGTTFRLYFPRAAGAGGEIDTSLAPPAAPKGGHETILVVEDNDDMRRIATRQLKEAGYQIIEAGNAVTALEILSSGAHVDLMFTDIVMPGGTNGFELAERALVRWPSLKIILTSGFPDSRLNSHGELSSRGLRLLSKPYRKEELMRMMREVLDG